MAKLLVAHGADVNLQADNLDSPFLYAGASGQTELVKLFLANGARFDVFNRYNGSALIPACERGHVETVKLLAHTRGYPVDHVNRLGSGTPNQGALRKSSEYWKAELRPTPIKHCLGICYI